MEADDARVILKVLSAAYPKIAISRETVEVYVRCLGDLPGAAVQAAVLKHVAGNKWFPTVAELRQAAIDLMPGNRAPTAMEAWAEVMREVQRIGVGDLPLYTRDANDNLVVTMLKPEFSHPAIARTVEAMGWREICLSEKIAVERAHFLKMYEVYVEREREDALLLPEVRHLAKQLKMPESPPDGRADVPANITRLADAKRIRD